ncbi:MAG: cation:proton antiporter, partial [Armatimonadota bacterium]
DMHDAPLLQELVIALGISLILVYLLHRLRVPAIVGYLVSGLIVGPHFLGLVTSRQSIDTMAEIGVILLLFTVGLEFSIKDLLRLKRLVFGAGALQVGVIIAIVTAAGTRMGFSWQQSVLYGFLFALSSTAVVFRLLQQRGESQAPHGRLMVSLLIFQDLAVIPMLLLLPVLQQGAEVAAGDIGLDLLGSLAVVAVILAAARLLLPKLLELVVRSRSREIFTLTTVAVALGVAYISGLFGISLALGAFLAGIVVSESVYSQQIMSEIAPLRDAFSGLFFISVGMLLDPSEWLADPLLSGGLVIGVIVMKLLVVAAAALIFGMGSRIGVMGGLGLAQIGEFSFIIASEAMNLELLGEAAYGQFISVSVITMALTPLFMMVAPALGRRVSQIKILPEGLSPYGRATAGREGDPTLKDHVIVVGYGVCGRNVIRVLEQLEVEYVVVELNPFTVRELQDQGERAVYGDASRMAVMEHASVEEARAIVVTVPDASSARQIVANARQANEQGSILVRTRLVSEVERLHDLGADVVVPEEFETSLQLAGLVMEAYGAPESAIEREKDVIRQAEYQTLCKPDAPCPVRPTLSAMLRAVDFEEVKIDQNSPAAGRTIKELNLRQRFGASISAVGRGEDVIGNPSADFTLQAGDHLFLFGSAEELVEAKDYVLGDNDTRRGRNNAPE